jgi:hypothetical protein
LPALLAHEILKLAARGLERVTDRHVGILVGASDIRIAVDDDVGRTRHGEVDPHAIGIALVMAMLGTPDDDTCRGDATVELLELLGFLPDPGFDRIRMSNVLERDVQRNLHQVTPLSHPQAEPSERREPIILVNIGGGIAARISPALRV